MNSPTRFLVLPVAAICALAWVACSGSNTAPSSVQGATIQGTVSGASSTAGSASSASRRASAADSAAGMTVTVMETGQSVTTDGSGRFVLTGLPSGSVTLHFHSAAADATLTVSGLVAGQTLTITIQVSGSKAKLEPGPEDSPGPSPSPVPSPSPEPSHGDCFAAGDHAEVEGNISATSGTGITVDQEGHGSFLCNVSASTEIRHGNTRLMLSDLKTGDHVHVSGTGAGSSGGLCVVNASEIKLQ
jgi:hypothetical protein